MHHHEDSFILHLKKKPNPQITSQQIKPSKKHYRLKQVCFVVLTVNPN